MSTLSALHQTDAATAQPAAQRPRGRGEYGIALPAEHAEPLAARAALDLGAVPALELSSVDPRSWRFIVKHALGRTFAAVALLLLLPALLLIALAVRVSSPGPVLFRQRRVGRDGHEFDLFKFRSMNMPTRAELAFALGAGCAPGGVEGADRRTWIGRMLRASSLDEMPQLLNVVRGDMTLVGPRPERPEFVRQFTDEIDGYADRHRVKAGMTGWAQVNGLRGQTSLADRVAHDNEYIRNWSFRLDVKILALTIVEVLRFRDS
jgi:lipopolysaccharide/colanic/teichoic acid biosynthesis glycosyltransferase